MDPGRNCSREATAERGKAQRIWAKKWEYNSCKRATRGQESVQSCKDSLAALQGGAPPPVMFVGLCPPSDVCWVIIPINYRYNPQSTLDIGVIN